MPPSTPDSSEAHLPTHSPRLVEDYEPGYPRFTALLSSHEPFLIFRRFARLRARLLLLKQDRLTLLEERLDGIDKLETDLLFLGNSRNDRNVQRRSLISDIEASLADYDDLAERTHKMLSLPSAEQRDVESLQMWLDGNRCLARKETAYLAQDKELVSLAPVTDRGIMQLEAWVEDMLIRFYRGFRNSLSHDLSTDACVYLYSGKLVPRAAKALLFLLIVLPLLMPVILCNTTTRISIRLIIIMTSMLVYLLIASGLTKSKTMELITATATYTTILSVLVSLPVNSKAAD
ncbi:hypothetical protein Z517_07173 [Fonsecaea pedrosoi CBS 271.37]|uniref:Unplaced genomic scaffold supercont1.4, whole genome shotgun sequence n=1 Tax=Fonsecaea pedrosoi CBS 271.37 TaxID=1442368 RepID=A0A0D2F1S8_9EURO|nr:uncharacterized protein Z517_07173 [Fonsecaea pedrosoi CBS 271.37]KIW80557.1 hypothetical protein Z517_07173 [Fonsecaea pedrosoi CBS 271.37]